MTTTAPTTAARLPGRTIKTDGQGRKYVLIQRVAITATEKVAVRVKIISNPHPESGRFAESRFDVIYLDGQPPALKERKQCIHQKGTTLTVGQVRAANLKAACRIALDRAQDGDVVLTRAQRRARTAAANRPATSSTSRAAAQANRAAATTGAELTASMAASITAAAEERQARVNRRPSEGGGSDVARRETAKQRKARLAREAKAALDASTAAATASIDAALAPVTEPQTAPAAPAQTAPESPVTES